MTSDKNVITIRFYPSSFPVFLLGRQADLPRAKSLLHFVQNVFFAPDAPENRDLFPRRPPDFVQNVQPYFL